jgi:hypothetical protein
MIAVAAVLALAGAVRLGPGLTASPLPSAAAELRTTGVYACVRHPIYTGLLLGGASVVLLGGRLTRVWVWLALLALLWSKTWLEERKLAARFPGYRDYATRTPRLIPDPRLNRPGGHCGQCRLGHPLPATDLVCGGEPNQFVAEEFTGTPIGVGCAPRRTGPAPGSDRPGRGGCDRCARQRHSRVNGLAAARPTDERSGAR